MDAPGLGSGETGIQENYALWVGKPGESGVEYPDLGAFSNPAKVYYLPYGTTIGIVVRDEHNENHSYISWNGSIIRGKGNEVTLDFTLTTDIDINFEWNYWMESVSWDDWNLYANYWNCYITAY